MLPLSYFPTILLCAFIDRYVSLNGSLKASTILDFIARFSYWEVLSRDDPM
jgi:hypothetical protein